MNTRKPRRDDWSEVWQGESVELLHALHLLTPEGKLNQDARRKLKQVAHFVQFLIPTLDAFAEQGIDVHIVDAGAGKSYLGLILYDLWLRHHPNSHLTLIETRPELVNTVRKIAKESGFDRVTVVESRIAEFGIETLTRPITALVALHACDTATDDALLLALRAGAKLVALVPCCQAELARLLDQAPQLKTQVLGELFAHPHHRREFASHLTNVFRALLLESHGYKVRVTELTAWEHTAKNELLLAERHQLTNPRAARRLEDLKQLFPLPLRLFATGRS